jgi:hypothetical protein
MVKFGGEVGKPPAGAWSACDEEANKNLEAAKSISERGRERCGE